MRNIAIIIAIVLILLVGGFYALNSYIYNEKQAPNDAAAQESVGLGKPVFEWTYREFSEGEIPRSEISLVARYENGTVQERVIDTIQGGCSVYGEPDADIYEGSEMIICYYAGLGYYFKVTETDEAYVVQRKVFEEASPDYSPAPEPFEAVAWFAK